MEFEEVKDSVKEWCNNRLKNPYFSSVFVVWLITNRVVVFGLFNFGENQNLTERVSWVHQQLLNKTIWFFHGFEGIIVYSFLMGFAAMIGFNYLNVTGKIVYNMVGRGAIYLQKRLEPTKWFPLKDIEELRKDNERLEISLDSKKDEVNNLKVQKEAAVTNLTNLQNDYESLIKSGAKNVEAVEQLESLQKLHFELTGKYEKLLENSDQKNDNSERQFEITTFLRSEASGFFDRVYDICENVRSSDNIPERILSEYYKKGLISAKDNIYFLTPKGKDFYLEYIKRNPSKKL